MPDPFKAKLTEANPLPARRLPADNEARAVGAGGMDQALEGYAVLSRGDPRSFNRNRQPIAPPVYPDGPNVSWEEEK
jgi:hypothetical protein